MAGMMAWGMFHAKPPAEMALPPAALKVFGVAMGALFAGVGAWGIWTAVAVFRRRGWARISRLVLAALLVFMGGSAMLEKVRWGIAASYGTLALIGAWWLGLFNRGATKQYFAEREPARESARPLSIGIIGWYLLAGAANSMVSLARPKFMQQMQRAAPGFIPTAAAKPQMGNMWVFGLISAAAFAVPI